MCIKGVAANNLGLWACPICRFAATETETRLAARSRSIMIMIYRYLIILVLKFPHSLKFKICYSCALFKI